MRVPAGEEEAAEQRLRVGAAQAGRGHRRVEHRAALVQLDLVLGEVRRLDAVAERTLPAAGLAAAEDRLEQRRLARAVRADQRDVLAALERERRVVQQLLVAGAQRRAPSASTTTRPDRAGFRNSKPSVRRAAGPGLDLLRLDAVDLLLLRLRLLGLRVLRAEALDEALEPRDVLGLRARPSFAACSARAACSRRQTCHLPGKKTERPRSSSSTAVVTASRNQRSCATRITAASIVVSSSSSHSIDSMSRWFVGSSSSSRSGCDGERARERGARQLAAREGRERPVEVVVGEAEPAHDAGGAVAPVVAAGVLEPRLRRGVAAHRPRRRGAPPAIASSSSRSSASTAARSAVPART